MSPGRRPLGRLPRVVPFALLLAMLAPGTGAAAPGHEAPGAGPPLRWAGVPPVGPRAGLRDPAIAGNGIGRILITNEDPQAVPNTGLLANLTGFRIEPFPNESSVQVGVDEVIGSYLVTFGLFQNAPGGAYPFFSVFDNRTTQAVFQASEPYDLVQPGDACDFALVDGTATNWTLDYDGQPFGGSSNTSVVDLGTNASTWASGVGFAVIALAVGEVVPSLLDVPTVFGVLRPQGWYLPTLANTTYLGAPAVAWGVEGRAENATLWPGEIRTGTSLAPVANGTTLWTGGPVPAQLTLSSTAVAMPGTGTTLLTAEASNGSGPLRGLPVAFRDHAGGSFVGPYAVTGGNGSAAVTFVAPNESAPVDDVLVVTPRTMGAEAAGELTLRIVPPTEVYLSGEGVPALVPGGTITFQVVARNASGAPLADVALSLLLIGFGVLSPVVGATAPDGVLNVSVSAPPSETSATVSIVVTSAGFWGLLRIPLRATSAPPSPIALLLPYLPWAIVALLVAGVAAVYLRRRLPKSPLPPLHLPPRTRSGPSAPTPPAVAPPPDGPGAPPPAYP